MAEFGVGILLLWINTIIEIIVIITIMLCEIYVGMEMLECVKIIILISLRIW